MKTFVTLFAHLALAHAAAVPQDAPAKPAHAAHGLGPFGLDLTFLQGFDMARLGPTLARMQPYFKTVVESGTLASLATTFIPTLKHEKRTALEPELRKTAKRFKTRLGPINLLGKNVRALP
jgi:hypothetical protein